MMSFPTSVDPVKPTFLTLGCSMRALPATEPAGEQVQAGVQQGHTSTARASNPSPPLTFARYHIDHPIWEPCSCGQLSQFEGGEGCDASWLQHNRVPGSKAGGHLPGHHHERVVPWYNKANDTEGSKEGNPSNRHVHTPLRYHPSSSPYWLSL